MKELSIEQKAKRYDEAYKKVAVRFGSNVADEIFLKESEDEKMLSNIVDCIKNLPVFYESININGEDKTTERFICAAINWLKSLKDRVLPKQEWSEEDEKIANSIWDSIDKSVLANYDVDEDKAFEWLKSLKDRIQPQPQPKQEKFTLHVSTDSKRKDVK